MAQKLNTTSVQAEVSIALEQLQTVNSPSWMRSFLTGHPSKVKLTISTRAHERHKAAKYQVVLLLSQL